MNLEKMLAYIGSCKKSLKIMEVCGTHTSAIVKNGIQGLLPPGIRLVSGPGCPVCVTTGEYIDVLLEFAGSENCCVLSFGDLFKVRGSRQSMIEGKAGGASFQVIYSPFEAVALAKANRNINYVVAAIGFETTIPVYALLMDKVMEENIRNIKLALSLKATIPALSYICCKEEIDGFICPGHVSVITGSRVYEEICRVYQKPFVIAGFEPEHILGAICRIVYQTETGHFHVENLYKSVVSEEGNTDAVKLINRYFIPADGIWRGIGEIKSSAFVFREEYARYALAMKSCDEDDEGAESVENHIPSECRCGDVMLGRITPDECGLFGGVCRPDNPEGPCMVSSEGACGIWYANKPNLTGSIK